MTTETTIRPTLRSRLPSLRPTRLLVALVAVDLALVAASAVRLVVAGDSFTDPWLLQTDGGWAELFGYVQQVALALTLLVLGLLTRHLLWVAYAAMFVCTLATDYLRLHERKGAWLAEKLAVPEGVLGLRANDLGEILVWGLLAMAPVAAAVRLHWRSDRWNRVASVGLAVLIAAYVFFGAVVDQLHVLVLDSWFGHVVGAVEDGGELIVLSLTLVYVLDVITAARRRRESVPDGADRPRATVSAAGSLSGP